MYLDCRGKLFVPLQQPMPSPAPRKLRVLQHRLAHDVHPVQPGSRLPRASLPTLHRMELAGGEMPVGRVPERVRENG